MSLVALDGMPLVVVGFPGSHTQSAAAITTMSTLGALNAASIMIGQVFTEDGNSHTIDTTGSSSLGWKSGAITFANAGTTLKVGLAAVDTANGPPARAANASNVITFDVSRSYTSAAAPASTSWIESVPTSGTKTIAHGDLVAFCVQMTAFGGADSVVTSGWSVGSGGLPTITTYNGTTYSAVTEGPNAVITFSDGKLGFFYGGIVGVQTSSLSWNSGSSPNEYGNFFQMPVPAQIYGIVGSCALLTTGGDLNFVLYSSPLGTPVAEKTASIDQNVIPSTSTNLYFQLFSSPYSATANQPLGAVFKPTTVNNVNQLVKSYNIAGHQKSETLGANGYGISRSGGAGAFAATNSNKDRYPIGLLVGAFDAGGGPVGQQCGM